MSTFEKSIFMEIKLIDTFSQDSDAKLAEIHSGVARTLRKAEIWCTNTPKSIEAASDGNKPPVLFYDLYSKSPKISDFTDI